ncbi:cation diffusion facilitator family transporter [Hymenobacter sp. DH14]|uniref:Cation diffusion facilitator family transporter n=1 Tax=Hymenobacter cyanobacteriorum TaxID=2926463 RepID=A0A9X1VJH6_9BACT|nr:cation diffusion facilitator family transporter [Hymenobacter cyanobacteriorum]MCI1189808.1 cation diffusion facilitator family transporter [Hymenobacter cyanobacteriorum]
MQLPQFLQDFLKKGPAGAKKGLDAVATTSERGIWALKWSFIMLAITSALQVIVFFFSGSTALLADTIHNVADAATAIPLWIAFRYTNRAPTKRFTYGYGRIEDLAGVIILLIILASGIVAGYESIQRFYHPEPVKYLWAVAAASVVGFIGNEAVAIFRIKVGKEIGSAALIADGYHARTDGIASLSVLLGVIGIWLGFPLADPIIGLIISFVIMKIVWRSGKDIFTRLLDGVDPAVVDEVRASAAKVPGVLGVDRVRLRWLGHKLNAEVDVAVADTMNVGQAHELGEQVVAQLRQDVQYLTTALVHTDAASAAAHQHA